MWWPSCKILDLFVIIDDAVSGINKPACAHERIVGRGGNNVCTSGGLPYVVKELVDGGNRRRGPIGEIEYHLGPNAGGN